MSRRFRVCLVGCGRMGRYRAELISAHPQLRLCAVVDPTAAVSSSSSSSPARFFPTFEEAAAAAEAPFDAVWIAAPSREHPPLIRLAAAAATATPPRIVFCEKPIADSVRQVADCYAACDASGVRLLCGWMRRFDAGYASVAARLAERRIRLRDPLARARLASHDWPPVPSRAFLASLGSIFEDLMCHDFNVAAHFAQDALPRWVEAASASASNDGVCDAARATVQFAPLCDEDCGGDGPRFEMSARRASQAGVYENTADVATRAGCVLTTGHNLGARSFFERHDASYRAEVDFVARALAGDPAEHPNTRRSCLITAQLIDLSQRSAALGGARLYCNMAEIEAASFPARPKL